MTSPLNDITGLRALVAIVEAGSVLGGAQALGIARSTLRRRLTQLEAAVGQPLLHRAHDGAVPTELGIALAARAEHALVALDGVMRSVAIDADEMAGRVRVALPAGIPSGAAARRFATFRAKHPGLRIECDLMHDPREAMPHGADLAVTFGESLEHGPAILSVGLRVRMWLVASPKYVSEHGTPTSVEDLKHHTVALWRQNGADPSPLAATFAGYDLSRAALMTNDVHLLHTLAGDGHALAWVPDGMHPEVDAEPLVPVLHPTLQAELPIWLMIPQAVAASARIQAVLNEVRDFLHASPLAPS